MRRRNPADSGPELLQEFAAKVAVSDNFSRLSISLDEAAFMLADFSLRSLGPLVAKEAELSWAVTALRDHAPVTDAASATKAGDRARAVAQSIISRLNSRPLDPDYATALRAIAEVCSTAKHKPSQTVNACIEAMEKAEKAGVSAEAAANAARRFLAQALRPKAAPQEKTVKAGGSKSSIMGSLRGLFSPAASARAANPSKINARVVNRALTKAGIPVTVFKGNGYFYYEAADKMLDLDSTYVCYWDDLTLDEWVEEVRYEYEAALGRRRTPLRPLGRTPNHHRTGLIGDDYPIDPYRPDLDTAFDPYDRDWRTPNGYAAEGSSRFTDEAELPEGIMLQQRPMPDGSVELRYTVEMFGRDGQSLNSRSSHRTLEDARKELAFNDRSRSNALARASQVAAKRAEADEAAAARSASVDPTLTGLERARAFKRADAQAAAAQRAAEKEAFVDPRIAAGGKLWVAFAATEKGLIPEYRIQMPNGNFFKITKPEFAKADRGEPIAISTVTRAVGSTILSDSALHALETAARQKYPSIFAREATIPPPSGVPFPLVESNEKLDPYDRDWRTPNPSSSWDAHYDAYYNHPSVRDHVAVRITAKGREALAKKRGSAAALRVLALLADTPSLPQFVIEGEFGIGHEVLSPLLDAGLISAAIEARPRRPIARSYADEYAAAEAAAVAAAVAAVAFDLDYQHREMLRRGRFSNPRRPRR